jgi:hypothetical protein
MYFHAGKIVWEKDTLNTQKTVVAVSEYGLDFNPGLKDVIICPPYARIFSHKGNLYALCKEGIFEAPGTGAPWEHDENFTRLHTQLWGEKSVGKRH